MNTRHRNQGFALFFALVFLLMMTLVAVTAMRGTAIELNMANNIANYEIAFERVESGRTAFSKVTPLLAACQNVWPQGTQLISGGTSCVGGSCSLSPRNPHLPDYPIEPGIRIESYDNAFDTITSGELENDVTTYRYEEYRFVGADGAFAEVAAVPLGSYNDPGGDASTSTGYSAGEKKSQSLYYEFASRTEGAANAQSSAHYKLPLREGAPNCLSNMNFLP